MRAISIINQHLEDRTYLVGDKIALADLTLVSVINWALLETLDKVRRAKYPNVVAHFELISTETSLKELFGCGLLFLTEIGHSSDHPCPAG